MPDLETVKTQWLQYSSQHLQNSGLRLPVNPGYQPTSRTLHTEHLWSILAEMQSTARWDPEAKVW